MPADDLHVEEGTWRLLRQLALRRRTTPDRLLAEFVAAEYDREFPGRRQREAEQGHLTPDERLDRFYATLGKQPPEVTPEADAWGRQVVDHAKEPGSRERRAA